MGLLNPPNLPRRANRIPQNLSKIRTDTVFKKLHIVSGLHIPSLFRFGQESHSPVGKVQDDIPKTNSNLNLPRGITEEYNSSHEKNGASSKKRLVKSSTEDIVTNFSTGVKLSRNLLFALHSYECSGSCADHNIAGWYVALDISHRKFGSPLG
ncbi:hypothetical protein N7528_007727 [Penicillium herquei]|nr:hypothetical protein N7528_007727 [Penicillium herquei]